MVPGPNLSRRLVREIPKAREDDHLTAAESMAESSTGSITQENPQIDRGHLRLGWMSWNDRRTAMVKSPFFGMFLGNWDDF